MPMLEERDLTATRVAFGQWLAAKLGPDAESAVFEIVPPSGTGYSSDTLLVSAGWRVAGVETVSELVLRLEQRRFRVVQTVDLAEQAKVMRLLAERTDVPVPELLWHEPDPTALGSPFLVMRRLPGRTASDQPPYHEAGWLFSDTTPAQRAEIWWAGLHTLAELHALDVRSVPSQLLPQVTGLPALLDRLADQQAWFDQSDLAVTVAARDWLRANQPAPCEQPVLLWGDARLGNMLFVENRVTGALDWEKAMIGPREIDLAWFLYVDRHHSEGCRQPRLAGLPGAAETVERYQELTGHRLRDLAYYQLLSAYHFALLMIRAVVLLIEFDLMPEQVGAHYVTNNSATAMLQTCLTELA